ncbi:MAG: hypothetical protein K9K88_18595 [Desulfobacterales bacterium]|nr:hypothetical protein [Desulfobacterales bacterium]
MRIAYLHYHLKTGGVTTVIRQQVEAVKKDCDTLVLSGSLPESDFPAQVISVDGLGYDSELYRPHRPQTVAEAVLKALHRHWPEGFDLIHVHNPTLAKNRNLLKILHHLQKAGVRLLCQVHDFAEDGRPQAYFKEPYPADCHWAVINSRDFRLLREAGLKPEGLHWIPNTVRPLPAGKDSGVEGKRVLYPVRAIRRKNIGEAILLSLFFASPAKLSITRPPNSAADMDSYRGWKDFVRQHGLSVEFEAGLSGNFEKLVAESRFLLTTSITEGFGFSFLEPWTAGKLLWGRKLADICRDFEKDGVRLDHLYARLAVPVSWIEENGFQHRWAECFRQACNQFQRPSSAGEVRRAWESISADGTVDFGLLDESAQKEVILSVLQAPDLRHALIETNPFLEHPGRIGDKDACIANNRRIVLSRYALPVYRKRLLEAYRQVTVQKVRHEVDKTALLAFFLQPETFSLLKWCPYDR